MTNRWFLGARLRTLPAAAVPVAMGTAVAADDHIEWWKVGAALVVALALQVATNYANDYSDGIRGSDTNRTGPKRLVAGGLASPVEVRRAAFIAFTVASVAGTVLSLAVAPWLIVVVGVPAVLAGWFYTGGKRPYGYSGFGEVFVFLFFGLVATLGSEFVQAESISLQGFAAGCAAGLLAMAMLLVNNLRDVDSDALNGKRTLSVRIGKRLTRFLYAFCIVLPFLIVLAMAVFHPPLVVILFALPLSGKPLRAVLGGAAQRDLIPVLGATGKLQLAFGALFVIGAAS